MFPKLLLDTLNRVIHSYCICAIALTLHIPIANGPRPERIANVLRKFIDIIFFGGFEAADSKSAGRVIARYARGNISIQFGRYLSEKKLEKLFADGDRAAARLAKRAKRAGI